MEENCSKGTDKVGNWAKWNLIHILQKVPKSTIEKTRHSLEEKSCAGGMDRGRRLFCTKRGIRTSMAQFLTISQMIRQLHDNQRIHGYDNPKWES